MWGKKTVSYLLQTFIDWDCAALTKADKPLNPWAVLAQAHPKHMKQMLPVCLAVAPDIVTTTIVDVPEQNKKRFHDYPATSESRKVIFNQVKEVIKAIVDHLPTQDGFFDKQVDSYSHFVAQMTPVELFLKTSIILERLRRETVNFDKMCQTVRAVQNRFDAVENFTVTRLSKSVTRMSHHHACKMPHPFMAERQ